MNIKKIYKKMDEMHEQVVEANLRAEESKQAAEESKQAAEEAKQSEKEILDMMREFEDVLKMKTTVPAIITQLGKQNKSACVNGELVLFSENWRTVLKKLGFLDYEQLESTPCKHSDCSEIGHDKYTKHFKVTLTAYGEKWLKPAGQSVKLKGADVKDVMDFYYELKKYMLLSK